MRTGLIVTFLLLPILSITRAQHSPLGHTAPTGAQQAQHHAFLDQEREALERGEGFGMAMAADRSGYPGPRHVLDLKAELKLTSEQEKAMQELFARMKERALVGGRAVLQAEQRLEEMFAQQRPEPELRQQTRRIAELRAELRWVHLQAHLAARKVLTQAQVEAYHHLRRSSQGHPPAHRSSAVP